MSVLGSILLAWAAVHSFAAVSYGFLAMRRTRPDELLGFATLSAGLALFVAGAAVRTDAADFRGAAHGQAVMAAGAQLAFAAFVRCAYELLGRPRARTVSVATSWGTVCIAMALAGLFYDPNAPLAGAATLAPSRGSPFELAMTPLGMAATVASMAITLRACWDVFAARDLRPDVRPLLACACLGVLAFVHDSTVRILHLRSPYLLEHVTVLGTIVMSYAILRRFVKAGDELSARTRELRLSYEELQSIQERLVRREQLAAIGELSAVIAHEVRNPLAILKNAIDGLRRPSVSDPDRESLLAILDDEADRLNRLVRDLLTYSRPVEFQANAVELAPLVQRAMDLACRAHPKSESVRFDVDLDGAPSSIPGDGDLLERAMINVIENAIHAMPVGGTVTIRARPGRLEQREAVALSFADTGTGMDTAVRSRAREAFFTTRPTGTGLGLAIVERVASAHQGRVELGDNPEGGTTVTLVLATA